MIKLPLKQNSQVGFSINNSLCACIKTNSIKQFLLIIIAICLSFSVRSQSKNDAFLCVYMDGGKQDLRYCVSTDGYHFEQVNAGNTILISTLGGKILRDPFIIRDKKDQYHLIATNAWAGRSFAMWDSDDLMHWENERIITVAPPGADKTWAPEAIYDEKNNNYVFYWTSSLGSDTSSWSIYYSTTTDFKKFSEAKILMPSENIVLDADIIKYNSHTWYMFYRYNSQVWRKEAQQVTGSYKNPTLMIDANGEGPFVYRIGKHKWNLIWDYYKENGGWYGVAESYDLTNWIWLTGKNKPFYNEKISFPPGVRHGFIIPITQSQFSAITKAEYSKLSSSSSRSEQSKTLANQL